MVEHAWPGVIDFIQSAEYDFDIQPEAMEISLSNRCSLQNQWNTYRLRGTQYCPAVMVG